MQSLLDQVKYCHCWIILYHIHHTISVHFQENFYRQNHPLKVNVIPFSLFIRFFSTDLCTKIFIESFTISWRKSYYTKSSVGLSGYSGICSQKQSTPLTFSWNYEYFLELKNLFSHSSKLKCGEVQYFLSSRFICGSNYFQKSHQIFLGWYSIGCRLFLYDCIMMKVIIGW